MSEREKERDREGKTETGYIEWYAGPSSSLPFAIQQNFGAEERIYSGTINL